MALKYDDPQLEAVKEFIRIGILAAVPVLFSEILLGHEWRVIVVAVVVALEKAWDKYKYVADSNNVITNFLKFSNVK